MKPLILITALVLIGFSCRNTIKQEQVDTYDVTTQTDSIEAYNELANVAKDRIHTISVYNTDDPSIENIKRPEQPIFKNLEIDTSKFFGIWVQYPNSSHADFWITDKSFYIVDYDGNGVMPYVLDGNKITIYYNDFIQKGEIISAETDTLRIKWEDFEEPTEYLEWKN